MEKRPIKNSTNSLWMRGVSFVALRNLIAIVAEHPEGLRVKEMTAIGRENHRLRTAEGKIPSATTLYHYRNTLLRLGILIKINKKYYLNLNNPDVQELIDVLSTTSKQLTVAEKKCFARFVIGNSDCRKNFFNLFLPNKSSYSLEEFIEEGQRVSWKRYNDPGSNGVLLQNIDTEEVNLWLKSGNEIQAILYGLRYWARNELNIIDELFLEDLGGVMYPTYIESKIPDSNIIKTILNSLSTQEWTKISIRDFALRWGPHFHISLTTIFKTLSFLIRSYPEYIVTIPTSESFATITAGSPKSEAYQLRSYLQDSSGYYISHIRIHRKFLEVFKWPTTMNV